MAKKRIKKNIETTIITSKDLKPAWDARNKVAKDTYLVITPRASKNKDQNSSIKRSRDGTSLIKTKSGEKPSNVPLIISAIVLLVGISVSIIAGVLDSFFLMAIFILVYYLFLH